ncbi:MAG: type II toxin-antitoxin system RelE/ParE family toxin [Hyphomicrobiaceae bacterium]|nr:type II toxin-antitoxin system RelE/ParE family toxin [Hyphomicrobiaceae bacterium]
MRRLSHALENEAALYASRRFRTRTNRRLLAAAQSKGAASVRKAIVSTLELVAQSPRIGRRQTIGAVRKIATRKHPYLIYYSVNEGDDEIVVLNIQHAARERDYSDASVDLDDQALMRDSRRIPGAKRRKMHLP